MPLNVIATSIGNPKDLTDRAKEAIRDCDLIIGEERKPTTQLLKHLGIQKPIELLNEHSDDEDKEYLAKECINKNVVLVSDAGTPGFEDPGPSLIKICRKKGIPVSPLPGPSSVATLLSMTSRNLHSFIFWGFLPRDLEEREASLREIQNEKRAVFLMDTPYRLKKTCEEVSKHIRKEVLLGLEMTMESESYIECNASELVKQNIPEKAVFTLLIYP